MAVSPPSPPPRPQPCDTSLRPHRRPQSPTLGTERWALSRERRGGEPCPGPLLWVGPAGWPVTGSGTQAAGAPGPGCLGQQPLAQNLMPSSQHGQRGRPPPGEQLPSPGRAESVGQEACRQGPQWLCSRNSFLGPQAVAQTSTLKARPQEASFRGGASRPGSCSGLAHSLALQGHQQLPAPPAPSDPQLRDLVLGLGPPRPTVGAGPSSWQPLHTPNRRSRLLHRSCPEGQGPLGISVLPTWTAPPPLQMAAVATRVPPAPACAVFRLGVWISEWAEGEREVAGMLLASHHLAHGGPAS